MIIMHTTENKNITQANKSWAKQRPNTKYATASVPNAVEKKKKIVVDMTLGAPSISPISFFGD